MMWEEELTSKCFYSFFEFSGTFMSVFITRENQGEHVFFLKKKKKNTTAKKRTQFVCFDYQNVNSLCSSHHYINSSC